MDKLMICYIHILYLWVAFLIVLSTCRMHFLSDIVAINYANYGIDDPNIVDIVITWVNGSDPKWYKQMKKDATKIKRKINNQYRNDRFVPHDEIKWALRSIETFLPWYNMVRYKFEILHRI